MDKVMKSAAFALASSILLATAAAAQTAPIAGEDKSRTPPFIAGEDKSRTPAPISVPSKPDFDKPDPDKPITITFAKLQRIVTAATAQTQAQCVAQGAQPELDALIRQATPEPPKPDEAR